MDEDLIEQVDLASNKHCLIYQVPCNNQAISIHSKHTQTTLRLRKRVKYYCYITL